jgi:rhodanese-related sulfurtransferase
MNKDVIIDVRERDEFAIEHIDHSINVPLSVFISMAPGILYQLKDKKVVFMCRSGARANQARNIAQGLGFNDVHTYEVYDGGIIKWQQAGNPVVKKTHSAPLPLMRQVQLVIGLGVLICGVLAVIVSPLFVYGAVAFGAGLTMAGLTGFCPLAKLISQMPWNRSLPSSTT